MMNDFLTNNRDELEERCKAKVALRPRRDATEAQLKNGIPLFLDQLTRTLLAERRNEESASLRISGASGGDTLALSEIGVAAAAHGKSLLALGFSVDQVVHNYGDLCQAITELAHEMEAPFSIDEFRTLNRCLDNAIADAVTEFSLQRDTEIADRLTSEANERLGSLVHEIRNSLRTARLSVRAMELGGLTLVGATGSVLKRSLASMRSLVDSSMDEVRASEGASAVQSTFSLASLVHDAKTAAELDADVRGSFLLVEPVDPLLRIEANRHLLLGALANLLRNAFKFTQPRTEVRLRAYAVEDRILIDVEDRCGGLAPDYGEKMFAPYSQNGADRTGPGLGLSIARHSVESDAGTLTVRNVAGVGCVMTINLPRCTP